MRLLAFLLLCGVVPAVSAAPVPYYRMDSLSYLASDVVLCDEGKTEKKTAPDGPEYTETTFKVIKSFKGTLKADDTVVVRVGLIFTRHLAETARLDPDKRTSVPPGRTLLFLKKEKERWQPVTGGIKVIHQGEAYCYGQFVSNPGPLYLARMAPENIEVKPEMPYSEELLVKDLEAALEKAKGLKKATSVVAWDKSIRREPPKK
jgi:hypothetical protein